jgi:hypothetical protein
MPSMSPAEQEQLAKPIHLWLQILPGPTGKYFSAKVVVETSTEVLFSTTDTSTTDLLYERLQAMTNSALRQLTNHIEQTIIKPNRRKKQ